MLLGWVLHASCASGPPPRRVLRDQRGSYARGFSEAGRTEGESARWSAVEKKLDEYDAWAQQVRSASGSRFRRVGREYLLTESFLREKSLEVLAAAVLDWAWTHTDDPDFLRKSPSEVGLYLLAKRSALAQVVKVGQEAHPHLDYTPLPDGTDAPPLELAVELMVGLVPGLGELADAKAAVTGFSFTGRKLREEERKLALLCVMLPFISSRAVSAGEETLERVALLTGRSLEEARVLQRVAQQLSPQEVKEVDRVLQAAARDGRLTEEHLQLLERVAQRLEKPLAEAASTFRQGGRVSLVGARADMAGARLVPGSAEHLSQAWVEYQFRHPEKYPRFAYKPDPEWHRLYRSILENKAAGSEFEQSILKARGYEKNTTMMMPPPGGGARGFIADSVVGHRGELVWGKPYRFVEVKGREEMALTGNLDAMISYVEKYGGQLEVWFRSSAHSKGRTRLSSPLQDRLKRLGDQGLVAVQYYP
ncbi:hypothetical protein [Hyalangium gracile]|uniref:hypothetical protein n=1 Tax=Hyalangium gracile TaxID=394092 RepID=UPI001CCD7E99|nr:hypothetical protein [Hyalangium gracile]